MARSTATSVWRTCGALLSALVLGAAPKATAQSLRVRGLLAPVELTRDSSGVVHIRAANEHDLFFAQGYNAARDRLFQLELWRRQATGTMAEVLGPRWVERDRASRLLRYRGSLTTELQHYHPRGAAIIGAFVDGINAYVARVARDSTLMPPELKWLGIKPGRWTPAVVISRHNALASNARDEVGIARAVRAIGAAAVIRRRRFEPAPASIDVDSSITDALDAASDDALLAAYDAFKNAPAFQPTDVMPDLRRPGAARGEGTSGEATDPWQSNNWVLAGSRTRSGKPVLANDPHRTISAPSLRYVVHLSAPGWNVIGAGEPALPGVSIGHNEVGAWGLTIFGLDVEDLYTYRTSGSDARAYVFNRTTERMRVIRDTIRVRNAPSVPVELRFTRHGPVLFEDTVRHVAVALRAAWLETGGAPYLASLRIDQARTWRDFRAALAYAYMPAENWIWADTSGAIGWQAAGIAPIRKLWDGLVPVPGDGRFEWSGYLPIGELPHELSPRLGFIGTANAFNVPDNYAHVDAVARAWAEPWRVRRIAEVLDTTRMADVRSMQRLQHDELSMTSRVLVPLLRDVVFNDSLMNHARNIVMAWDGVLSAPSIAAAVYAMWERSLTQAVSELALRGPARTFLRTAPLSRVTEWMTAPDSILGGTPVATRDSLLRSSFVSAVSQLRARLGANTQSWAYGQAAFHHVRIAHPLDGAVNDSLRAWLSPGPLARGGYANTLNATGNGDNQTAGASVRVVMDLANWDLATMTNTPGQSGDPRSAHYRDLFAQWARGEYLPLSFTNSAIAKRTEHVERLRP